MGDVENMENNKRNELRLNVGDRVFIKPELLEKYVAAVQGIDERALSEWRQGWEQAKAAGKEGEYDRPHPKAQFISLPNLGIVEKAPGRFRLALYDAPLGPSVWVDAGDVQEVFSRANWQHPEEGTSPHSKKSEGVPEIIDDGSASASLDPEDSPPTEDER